MRAGAILLGVVLVAYALVLGGVFFTQRQMLYPIVRGDGLYDQIWAFLTLPLPASTAEAGHRAEVHVMSAP